MCPSLLLRHVSAGARNESKSKPAVSNPPNARATANIRDPVLLMDAGAARRHVVTLTLNKIGEEIKAPVSKYIRNNEAL